MTLNVAFTFMFEVLQTSLIYLLHIIPCIMKARQHKFHQSQMLRYCYNYDDGWCKKDEHLVRNLITMYLKLLIVQPTRNQIRRMKRFNFFDITLMIHSKH